MEQNNICINYTEVNSVENDKELIENTKLNKSGLIKKNKYSVDHDDKFIFCQMNENKNEGKSPKVEFKFEKKLIENQSKDVKKKIKISSKFQNLCKDLNEWNDYNLTSSINLRSSLSPTREYKSPPFRVKSKKRRSVSININEIDSRLEENDQLYSVVNDISENGKNIKITKKIYKPQNTNNFTILLSIPNDDYVNKNKLNNDVIVNKIKNQYKEKIEESPIYLGKNSNENSIFKFKNSQLITQKNSTYDSIKMVDLKDTHHMNVQKTFKINNMTYLSNYNDDQIIERKLTPKKEESDQFIKIRKNLINENITDINQSKNSRPEKDKKSNNRSSLDEENSNIFKSFSDLEPEDIWNATVI